MSCPELDSELQNWLSAGQRPQLWWRDDDAVSFTPELEKLTGVSCDANIEILLAVVPAGADKGLATYIKKHSNLKPCVHGWSHTNHAPESEKRCELGTHRPIEEVLADIGRGRQRLAKLLGNRLESILVPPWNRMRDDLAPRLPEVGINAFSTFAHRRSMPQMQVNTHLDLMNWKAPGGAVGKSLDVVQTELTTALNVSRANGFYPIGLLTHHLVHDDAAWATLSALVAHPDLNWISVRQAFTYPSITT